MSHHVNTVQLPAHAPVCHTAISAGLARITGLVIALLSSIMLVATAYPSGAEAAGLPTGDLGPCLCGSIRQLHAGEYLLSSNGLYKLAMQGDGNLVVYSGS